MFIETVVLSEERKVSLQAYIQGCGEEFPNFDKRPGVVVIPGGGYEYCSEREADPVAFPYLAAGYQVFILRYSLNEYAKWPQPLEDFDEAMELIKKNAAKWMVCADKIAIVGFSAGGHLAAAAATMAKNRPQAAVLGYPLTGEDTKWWNKTAPSTIVEVDKNTPPCFIFATRTDATVPVANSLDFASALDKAGVMFEMHIYSFGEHGLSTDDTSIKYNFNPSSSRVKNWVSDSIGFIREAMGDFEKDGIGSACFENHFEFPEHR